MTYPTASTIATIALVPLLAWRIYVRFRRASGRQRLSRYRGPITLAIYSILIGAIASANVHQPYQLLYFAITLAIGCTLAQHALKNTRFEPTPSGLYYTPHGPIGISLAVLFVLRLIYRLFEVYVINSSTVRSFGEFARSPLTLLAFGLMAGYYSWYMLGLVRWRGRVLRAKRERETRQRKS